MGRSGSYGAAWADGARAIRPAAHTVHSAQTPGRHPPYPSRCHLLVAQPPTDILGVRVTVSGYRPRPPALLVSNHVSWLDIVILGGLTHTDFLSKDEVRRWPLIGWLAARAGPCSSAAAMVRPAPSAPRSHNACVSRAC